MSTLAVPPSEVLAWCQLHGITHPDDSDEIWAAVQVFNEHSRKREVADDAESSGGDRPGE